MQTPSSQPCKSLYSRLAGLMLLPLAGLWLAPALAGGPLILEGPSGNTPVRYQNPALSIHVESGSLGLLSNTDADNLVREAFKLWNNVAESTITLQMTEGQLPDVDYSNFQNYLPTLDQSDYHENDGLNPLIYDDTGEIIDAYFGVGASNNTVGFAASIWGAGDSYFAEGYAVINGKAYDPGSTAVQKARADTRFILTIAHEIGHMLGLDHSQADISNTDPGCYTATPARYPLMYPFVCRTSVDLHSDDAASLYSLYPVADIGSRTGIIEGLFLNSNGKALPGANLWAQSVDDTSQVYSVVSDYLKQKNGFYRLQLPPGNYNLYANSVNEEFYGGSSVGPWASTRIDLSFQVPFPMSKVVYVDNSGQPVILSVNAGETVTVNFSNEGKLTLPSSDSTGSESSSSLAATPLLSLLIPGMLLLRRRRRAARG